MALSEGQRVVLDFERTWWTRPGPKERGIREILAMSPSAYYRTLGTLLDDADAMSYDPLVIRRWQRVRGRRRRSRFEARSAEGPPNP